MKHYYGAAATGDTAFSLRLYVFCSEADLADWISDMPYLRVRINSDHPLARRFRKGEKDEGFFRYVFYGLNHKIGYELVHRQDGFEDIRLHCDSRGYGEVILSTGTFTVN